MGKVRIYSTFIALFAGLVLAYILVQLQHNTSFLLGDILRLQLTESFVGVYYTVESDKLIVSTAGIQDASIVSLDVWYNTDRVAIDVDAIISDHVIDSIIQEEGMASFVFIMDGGSSSLMVLPFVSDEEYHILVSGASITIGDSVQPLSIQRL